jgi:eukaryotic-like serine/threonine-protein kinase
MTGRTIANYRIEEKLGEGGMGLVYKATDLNLDRFVAIKVLRTELSCDPGLLERFHAEAKAQAHLNHTNIASLYNFLEAGGQTCVVMEYLEGETLEQTIRRRGLLPWQEAVPLFKQALLGIGFAHRMGIVHRDIKPGNIMVNPHGIVKVMDFGIAKVIIGQRLSQTGTQAGSDA